MDNEKIPFLDLKEQYQQVKEEIFPLIEKVFDRKYQESISHVPSAATR